MDDDKGAREALAQKVDEELAKALEGLNSRIDGSYRELLQARLDKMTQLALNVHPATESGADGPLDQRALASGEAARRYGSDAMRMAFLLNGGALTAIIAFLGTDQASQLQLGTALACFGVGAVLAAVASLIAYFGQSLRATDREKGRRPFWSSVLFGAASLLVAVSLGMSVLGAAAAHEKLKEPGNPALSKIEITFS